jgi:hypothetical protein
LFSWSDHSVPRFGVVHGALMLFLASGLGFAQKVDWFSTVQSAGGIEVAVNSQLFSLFALFNAAGLDAGERQPSLPFETVRFGESRQAVRARIAASAPTVQKEVRDFVAGHPEPMEIYLAAILGDRSKAAPPRATALSRELLPLIERAHNEWKLSQLYADSVLRQRGEMGAYSRAIDLPLARLKEKIGNVKAVRTVILLNALDAPDTVHSVRMPDGTVQISVGPSNAPNVFGVVREVAAHAVRPLVAPVAARWAQGTAVLQVAKEQGASEPSAEALMSAILAQALSLEATGANESTWQNAQVGHYSGMAEVRKQLSEGKSVEAIAASLPALLSSRILGKK